MLPIGCSTSSRQLGSGPLQCRVYCIAHGLCTTYSLLRLSNKCRM
jgi:hypothetical protein